MRIYAAVIQYRDSGVVLLAGSSADELDDKIYQYVRKWWLKNMSTHFDNLTIPESREDAIIRYFSIMTNERLTRYLTAEIDIWEKTKMSQNTENNETMKAELDEITREHWERIRAFNNRIMEIQEAMNRAWDDYIGEKKAIYKKYNISDEPDDSENTIPF
jgi:hypothetical protein